MAKRTRWESKDRITLTARGRRELERIMRATDAAMAVKVESRGSVAEPRAAGGAR
jgi:hypothetical protein